MAFTIPKRSKRYGVGKEIGGAIYVHRQYESRLGSVVQEAKEHLPNGFHYQVVKVNEPKGEVSFIQCHDFDTACEPTVGDIVTVESDGNVRHRRQSRDPEIYHHKWLFVDEDYEGFDVASSRARSVAWLALEDVDRKRIGRKSYWSEFVQPRLEES